MLSLRPRTWALLAALAPLLLTAFLLPPRPFTAPAPAWRPAGTDARGVFHVHTRRSDGTGTVEDVAAAAAAAGLHFVIVTDHGDATREPAPPAYRSGVLCIDAVEISTAGGHYAALGLGRAPYPLAGEPRDVVEDVHRLGGFGVVSHPLSAKARLAWRDWDVPFDAVEWLNGDSLWRDASAWSLARSAWTYLFRPAPSLARLYEHPPALARWDDLARRRRVIALAGTDAHARLGFREGPEPYASPFYLEAPSYRVAFEVASLRVRLAQPFGGDAAADASAVIAAIRAGRLHSVVDGLGRAAAFDFTAASGGVTAVEGGELPLTDPAVIRVRSNPPPGGWIELLRDGARVHRVRDQELVYASDRAGSYRAEVWVPAPGREGLVPWIVGNPIRVGRIAATATHAPTDAPGHAVPLAGGADLWGAEHDPTSRAAVARDAGVRCSYALGPSGRPAPYAALQVTTGVPPGTTGVAFAGRAERPMRVSVQLRVSAAGEGLRWQRSVYLEPTAREVFVPFAEMTPVGETVKGPPRLAEVGTVLFVVDTVNTAPGSTGHFVVTDLRFVSPAPKRASHH